MSVRLDILQYSGPTPYLPDLQCMQMIGKNIGTVSIRDFEKNLGVGRPQELGDVVSDSWISDPRRRRGQKIAKNIAGPTGRHPVVPPGVGRTGTDFMRFPHIRKHQADPGIVRIPVRVHGPGKFIFEIVGIKVNPDPELSQIGDAINLLRLALFSGKSGQ